MSSANLSEDKTAAVRNQVAPLSNSEPLPFKSPEMTLINRGGPCEICEGE
jgi:hypothetical protein